MIASVRGPVRQVGLDRAVVEVGGVGLLVHTTPATVAELRPGHEVTLETTLVVREESLTLYGFADADARALFEQVQTVSGVGPRLALAMLSVLAPDDVRRALSQGDLAVLTKVPGIGRKSAERLVLELKDKVTVVGGGAGGVATSTRPAAGDDEAVAAQVREALEGLGWSTRQASDAVSSVTAGQDTSTEVSALLRAALQELGR